MNKLQYIALGAILTTAATAQNEKATENEARIKKAIEEKLGANLPEIDANTKAKIKALAMKMGDGNDVTIEVEKISSIGGELKDVADFDFKGIKSQLKTQISSFKLPAVYLGVSIAKTNEVVASQLGITSGIGLSVISKVEKESPAGKSGILKNDILYKLNDQLLVNKDQLMNLLGSFKAGDKVKLSYYRKGKLAVSEVTLEKRKKSQATDFNFGNMDGSVAIGKAVIRDDKGNERVIPLDQMNMTDGGFDFDLNMLDGVESKVKMTTVLKTMVRFKDDNGSYTLKKTEKGLHLNAQDNDGKELFNGLIEPETEWKKIPAEIVPIVEKMKKIMSSNTKK